MKNSKCHSFFSRFPVSSVSNPVISELSTSGSCETLSEPQLSEVLTYALSRLFKGAPPPVAPADEGVEGGGDASEKATLPPPPACSLLMFYRVGRAPNPQMILDVVNKLEEFNLATTIVPVCQLNHPNTFISLCGYRHE